jgi:phosphonate C-P lyase system protein PhnG
VRDIDVPEILGLVDEASLERLLELLPDDLELVGPPREGLVLMTRREGLGGRFHLGEVLASQCRVRYRGEEGWAMTMGGDPRRALVAAAIEAMDKFRPLPAPRREMEGLLREGRDAIVRSRAEEARLTASTRVEFDLLPGA